MRPLMNNGGRWDHIASDAEIERAMRDKQAEVLECAPVQMTWIISTAHLTVLRAGAMGGDVRSIEGGWVYANPFSMMRDVDEMRQLSRIGA